MPHGGTTALLILILLVAAGAASALTIATNGTVFALTRSDRVTWATNVTIETSSVVVTSTTLKFDGASWDVSPESSGWANVTFERWGIDRKDITVTREPAAEFTFTLANPGGILIVAYSGVTALADCLATTATCSWTIDSATRDNVSIHFDPTGQNNGTRPCTTDCTLPPAAATGGGGGGASVETLPAPLPPIPNPIKLFPRLGAFQWLCILVGLSMVMSASGRTSTFLPGILRVPGSPIAKLLIGSIVLTLVYLSVPPL